MTRVLMLVDAMADQMGIDPCDREELKKLEEDIRPALSTQAAKSWWESLNSRLAPSKVCRPTRHKCRVVQPRALLSCTAARDLRIDESCEGPAARQKS